MVVYEDRRRAPLEIVLLFVACGLASGLGASVCLTKDFLAGHAHPHPITVWLVDGASFLLGVTLAHVGCKSLRWLKLKVSLARYLLGAPIVI